MTPRPLVFVLALIALAITACSNNEPSKEQVLSRANELFAADKFDQAAAEYRAVLRASPSDLAASRGLGISYYEQGKLAEAYPVLLQAAARTPDDVLLQLKLAAIYLNGGAFKQARDAVLLVLAK